MTTFSSRYDRFRRIEPAECGLLWTLPVAHPLPKRLLPEARGYRVTRLRASLRRPPMARPSLS